MTSPPPNAAAPAIPAWKRSLPNALTMARVGLALAFFGCLVGYRYDRSPVLNGEPDWVLLAAAAVFVLAAITDALDGHLARKWGVVSLFGRVMDPFADKLLVLGGFVCLAGGMFTIEGSQRQVVQVSAVYPVMAVVVLARELLITSLRGAFESRGVSFAATASGKWKMILQSVCIPLVLVVLGTTPVVRFTEAGIDRVGAGRVIQAVVWPTVIVTVWSGFPYVLRAIRQSASLHGSGS